MGLASTPNALMTLELRLIRTDGGTQMRPTLHGPTINEYAGLMRDQMWDWAHDPPTVFHDSRVYWLADGFHRVAAAQRAGLTTYPQVAVLNGNLDDAIWYATRANAQHGLYRSNETKRRAVIAALDHPRARAMSEREIARWVGVSHNFVNVIRRERDSDAEREQRKHNATAGGRGSPVKQIERWWRDASPEDRHALYQRVVALHQNESEQP